LQIGGDKIRGFYIRLLKLYIAFLESFQKRLIDKGFVFANASRLMRKIFLTGIISFVLWNVLRIEAVLLGASVLPWYTALIVLFITVIVVLCELLLGREDYEVFCLKETLHIHRLCTFLRAYKELNREETVKWLIKIADGYYENLRGILLQLVTGRNVEWQKEAEMICIFARTRILRIMWSRIFEHIGEMDGGCLSASEEVFKSHAEYADAVCAEEVGRLVQKRVFVCKLVAYLPVFCTVIFYMIYPFVLEGIRLLNTYSEEMKALGLN